MQQLEESIGRYLDELDRADRQPDTTPPERTEHLKEKIAKIKAQMKDLRKIEKQMEKAPDGQISMTDPDARSMATSGRGTGTVGYNVQTAVDTKNHMIVAHDVVNLGHDRSQLASMASKAYESIGEGKLTVLADRGYYASDEIFRCVESGIRPLVPKTLTSTALSDGQFDKRDFRYDQKRNEYICPAGERAKWRTKRVENGLMIHRYWASACPRCPIREQCTPSDYRRISRWEHEQVLEEMQRQLERTPEASRIRRQTVEHVFGTLKSWMGATHFLLKTLPKVRTEVSLHVLAYNMRRALTIMGTRDLVGAIRR